MLEIIPGSTISRISIVEDARGIFKSHRPYHWLLKHADWSHADGEVMAIRPRQREIEARPEVHNYLRSVQDNRSGDRDQILEEELSWE
jgi:hypothetical protein